MYRCLFEVLGLVLPLTAFQCALLEHLNVASSQLYPNSWTMVRTFEVLCPFFNIQPIVLVFLYFFQMKLIGKIGWVSLNSVSKKLLEFDSNVFHCFKDCFFKVLSIEKIHRLETKRKKGLSIFFSYSIKPMVCYWSI